MENWGMRRFNLLFAASSSTNTPELHCRKVALDDGDERWKEMGRGRGVWLERGES